MLDHTPGKQNRFLLVYGSATGQSQAIAEDIAERASTFGLVAELHSLEETGKKFNIEKEKCVVFVTSTTGDGEPPPNAEKFMRRIKKRTLGNDYLAHLHYCMLGLGDSNYTNFCRCPRNMDSRLEELGAQRFYSTGLADDGVGLEIVVDPWLEGLYPALQKFLGVAGASDITLTETVQSKWKQEKNDNKTSKSLVEGDGSLTKTSSTEESVPNNELVNENSDGNSIPVSSSDSDLADKLKFINVCADGHNEHDSTFNGDLNVIDTEANAKVSSESKLNVLSQKLQSPADHLLSHTVDGSTNETAISSSNAQTKVIPASGNVAKSLDSVAKPKWPETSCIPATLTGLLSLSVPLARSLPPLSEQTLTVPVLPPPFLSAIFERDHHVQTSALSYQNGCKLPCAASDVFTVQILSARVLTASDAVKKTLLLRLNLEGLDFVYSPGDAISIICPNNSSEVNLLLDRLGQMERADDSLTLSVIPDTKKRRAAVPPHIHPVTTLRHILTTCVNIREPPSKAFIRALIEHTYDELDVRRMQELCSKEGVQEYTQFVREPNVSLLDFLYAFPSCKPRLETVLEHLPRLQPRPYSICSCPGTNPSCVDLVFNVVEIASDKSKGHLYERRGVCTGWLDDITSSLQSGNSVDIVEISIFRRTNQHFRPPEDISKPLIMIGPGTGVAPFIGFLHERAHRKDQLKDGQAYGATWLFYGCRNKDKDYLFREELHKFEAEGTLTNLCVACSRDPPAETPACSRDPPAESSACFLDPPAETPACSQDSPAETPACSLDPPAESPATDLAPRRYVQDLLWLMAQEISRLLTESEAFVYVCGDAKNMTKDVNEALEGILQKVAGLSPDEAHMFMMKKRIHKTYFEDVWV